MPRLQTLLTSFLLALGLALGLAACGGGGSSSSTPLNVSPGVYSSSANNDEILVVLVRNTFDAQTPNWFGLKFTNGSADPDFYAASISNIGTSSPSGTSTKYFQNISNLTRTGTTSLSMPTETKLSSTVALQSDGQENANTLTWQTDALNTNQYVFGVSATSLTGSWTGRWSYGAGSAGSQNLDIQAGQASASQSIGSNCPIGSAQLSPLENGVNVYSVQLSVSAATLCTAFNQAAVSFKGLAYISTSPISGKTRRLNLMAVSTNGKAIFYRGDQ